MKKGIVLIQSELGEQLVSEIESACRYFKGIGAGIPREDRYENAYRYFKRGLK